MAVKLTVVGSSPAWPNPGGAQSGYLVEYEGSRLLLDCGPGVLPRLREQEQLERERSAAPGGERGTWPTVDAVVTTHWHLDHWGDIVPWVWGTMFGLGRELPPPQLWVPPDGRHRLADFGSRLGWEDMFEGPFEIHEYAAQEPFRVGSLVVVPMRVPHYRLDAYGMRVSNGTRTLAYSGDSGPSDSLADLARGVDLFVCEATLERGELDGEPRGHLSAEEAVAVFEASGAKRLLVTHRPSELPLADGLELAYDGLVVDV